MTESFIEERLKICESCPYNFNGICGICGCPINDLVLKKEERCTHQPAFWGAHSEPKAKKQEPSIITESPPQLNGRASQESSTCVPCNKHRH